MENDEPIFIVSGTGELTRMRPSAPPNEDALQSLIEHHPEIIADSDGALLLIRREQRLADSEASAGRWAIDHLFVTRGAVPVLVEVKRAADTRIRREVIGQLLEYAANAVAYWPAGVAAEAFERTCRERGVDSEQVLESFLSDSEKLDGFWSEVEENFKSGRVKLVLVADRIQRELATIIEFLNDQMSADVRAVELRYFEGDKGVRTLAPRVIGETERSRLRKSASRARLPPISKDEWIEKFILPLGDATASGFRIAMKALEDAGAKTEVAQAQGSIYAVAQSIDGRRRYPMFLRKDGAAAIRFNEFVRSMTESVRRKYLERFGDVVGPFPPSNVGGHAVFPVSRLAQPDRVDAFRDVVGDWIDACRNLSTPTSSGPDADP